MEADPSVKSSVDDVHTDGSANDWVLLGFAPEDAESTKLVVLGTGSGGIEAMAAAVPEADIAYGVVRRNYVMDEAQGMGKAKTSKLIRVTWRPEAKIPLKRKMKIGTLDGQIKKALGSTHADLECDSTSQMTDKAVVDLIDHITQKADMVASAQGKQASSFYNSGTAVQARTAAGDKAAAGRRHDAYMDASNLTGNAKGAEFEWQDLDAVKAAIQKVRDDHDSTNWMSAGYVDKKTIALIASGASEGDPIPDMLVSFKDATMCFGFFRVTETIDKTIAVRFCFVAWQPDDIPVMHRASQATHRGGILPIFRPYTADFSISTRDELDFSRVMDHLMKQSGTKSMVTDAKPALKEEAYQRKFIGVKDDVIPVEFVDRDALDAAIKAVRLDSDPTTWAVASYNVDGKNLALAFRSSGTGGPTEFAQALCADAANTAYGLIRVQQIIDNRAPTIKFLFVTFQGKDTPPIIKAKVSTLRGAVLPAFQPFHSEWFIDRADEITDASVQERLR